MDKKIEIEWTDYLQYRARIRGLDLAEIDDIVRYSTERYLDCVTDRRVVIGKCSGKLVVVPYEVENDLVRPVTVHVTSRAQINARINSERFRLE